MKARRVEKQLKELAAQMRQEDPEFNCGIEMVVGRDPVAISKRLFFLKDLERIVKEVKGLHPKIIGTIADSDGYHFRRIGIPSLWIGPGNLDQGFHGLNEHITVQQLLHGCQFFTQAIQNFCGVV
jgi:acetylornithine deacetylase/succinyl-diaminopimelate desuccinylase-like protein